jgi:Dienelactone hydrolase family
MDGLPDFTTFAFTHQGRERTVYRKGTGPAVLIMHEVPGISAEVARFARRVVDAGFTVFMPRLFGPVGVKTTPLNRVTELIRICISREFHVLAENRSSPITEWLRALARHIHQEKGGGIGVIGMCVTRNCTYANPRFLGGGTRYGASVVAAATHSRQSCRCPRHAQTFANARRRITEEGLKVVGVRFHGDTLFCRAARFETLRRELGDGFDGIELPAASAKRQPEPPHGVLTIGLIDLDGEPTHEAVEHILGFLSARLR